MSGPNILIINPVNDIEVLKGLASELRVRILELLREQSMNVNELTHALDMPQSTVATNVQILKSAGLIRTETVKARKGSQKICHNVYQEMMIQFPQTRKPEDDLIEVEMPIGLYTSYEVSAPCGLCSTEGIIGYLDVPEDILNPRRMKAGLLWFEKGHVEYKFPNNSLYKDKPIKKIELSAELSSETPGTNKNWLSDIMVWVDDVDLGYWTSPGDFGDHRGKLTPLWWKLEGSQYGLLKHWIAPKRDPSLTGCASPTSRSRTSGYGTSLNPGAQLASRKARSTLAA